MRSSGVRLLFRRFSGSAKQLPSENAAFLAWLDELGAKGEATAVTLGASSYGRALVAERNIAAGTRMLEISRDVIITRDRLPQEVSKSLDTENDKTRLSLFLLAERHKGQASPWAPFIRCLPSPGEIQSTIFWKNEELSWLEQSAAYRETMDRRKVIQSEFDAVHPVLVSFRGIFGNVTLEDFMHAYATVTSRSWGVSDKVSSTSMIPFVDFLNHDCRCRSLLSYDTQKNYVVAVADKDYAAGDEVFLCYGYSPNAFLAVDYGFALPHNPHENVEVWVEIPQADLLRKTKLEVLSRHNMRTKLDSGGRWFSLSESSGKGIPDSLRAFARVICARSCEDLEEMVAVSIKNNSFYGCCPRQNETEELRAMASIRESLKRQLYRHYGALEALDNVEEDSPRKSIAVNVLKGELRVLQSFFLS